jgi:hypothetical protein
VIGFLKATGKRGCDRALLMKVVQIFSQKVAKTAFSDQGDTT